MNWDQIQGQWKQMKGEALQTWGKLTDDELDRAAGDRDKLEGLIQQKYGATKEQAREEVEKWMARH